MEGDQLGQFVLAARGDGLTLEPGAGCSVEAGALGTGQRSVGDFSDQDVPEDVTLHPGRPDDVAVEQGREAAGHRVLRERRVEIGDRRRLERPAEHGPKLDRPSRCRFERIEPRQDRGVDGVRQGGDGSSHGLGARVGPQALEQASARSRRHRTDCRRPDRRRPGRSRSPATRADPRPSSAIDASASGSSAIETALRRPPPQVGLRSRSSGRARAIISKGTSACGWRIASIRSSRLSLDQCRSSMTRTSGSRSAASSMNRLQAPKSAIRSPTSLSAAPKVAANCSAVFVASASPAAASQSRSASRNASGPVRRPARGWTGGSARIGQ